MEIISDGVVLVLPVISQQISEFGIQGIEIIVFILVEKVRNMQDRSKIHLILGGVFDLRVRMHQDHRLIAVLSVFVW